MGLFSDRQEAEYRGHKIVITEQTGMLSDKVQLYIDGKITDSCKITRGRYALHALIEEDNTDIPVLVEITQVLFRGYKLYINQNQVPLRKIK